MGSLLLKSPKTAASSIARETKITLISGPLGAGKTTILDMILQRLVDQDDSDRDQIRTRIKKCLVITNDLGKGGTDNKRIARWHQSVTIAHIDKDCMCCDAQQPFVAALHNAGDVDQILIEPSGAASTGAIVDKLPPDQTQIIGVVTPSDLHGEVWRRSALPYADIVAVTRALKHQQRALRKAIAHITKAPVWFLPDPYRTVEPGEPAESIDVAWQSFLGAIEAREDNTTKSIFFLTDSLEQQTIGEPTPFPPMEADDLQDLLQGACERAKGITTIVAPDGSKKNLSFDFAYQKLRLHEVIAGEDISETTVIATPAKHKIVTQKTQDYLAGKRVKNSPISNVIQALEASIAAAQKGEALPQAFDDFNRAAITQALQQADHYFALEAERVERQNNKDFVTEEEIEAKMGPLGDAIYYDTPIVWLAYKAEAYGQEQLPHRPAPVRTWKELLQHASPKGYICTSRLTYLREAWLRLSQQLGTTSNLDSQWPEETSLEVIINDPLFQRFAALIIPEWIAYERSTLGKWKNY